jgi:hypothetical protein
MSDLSAPEKVLLAGGVARIAFVVPSMVSPRHLEMPEGLPLTSALLHTIAEFSQKHRSLTRQDIDQTRAFVVLREEENRQHAELAKWWAETREQHIGDTKLWKAVCDAAIQSPVELCLRRQIDNLRLNAEPWTCAGPDNLKRYCKRIDSEAAASAFGYERIFHELKNAVRLIRACAEAIERRVEAERKLTHNDRGLMALRSGIVATIGTIREEWQSVIEASTGLENSSVVCLIGFIEGVLDEFLGLPRTAPEADRLMAKFRSATSIQACLQNHLLLFPDLERDSDGLPVLKDYLNCVRRQPLGSRSLVAMCRWWIRLGGFESARELIPSISDQEVVAGLRAEMAEALPVARATLIRQQQEIREMLEMRFLDDCITEAERATLDGTLSSIQPSDVREFPPQRRRLDHVRAAISDADARIRSNLSGQWEEMQPELAGIDATEEERTAFRKLIAQSLERGSFRAVEELLAQLAKVIEEGGHLGSILVPPTPQEQLDQFLAEFQALAELAAKPPTHSASEIGEGGRLLIERWSELQRLGCNHLDLLNSPLLGVLEQLGLVRSADQPSAARPQIVGGGMVRARVPMSIDPRDARPFWQFGSRSKSTTVLLVWPRESSMFSTERMVRQIFDSKLVSGGVGLLVLYFGQLSLEKRRLRPDPQADDIEFPVALADDMLILHLARLPQARPAALLRCSLPFAAPNPYIDAGPIPSEMFFGRPGQVAALQRYPGGQSIVYGGRQLGKSALLE